VTLPASVQAALDAYSARYQELKAPRKLQWKTGLGTVRLELEHGGRSVQYAVSPIHAAIIMHFEERARWPARELADAVGAPLAVLRKKVVFWVNQGVLAESPGQDGAGAYHLVEAGEGATGGGARGPGEEEGVTVVADEEGESAVASAEEQMASDMQIYKVRTEKRMEKVKGVASLKDADVPRPTAVLSCVRLQLGSSSIRH
jgi:anaphase-promoting complex subunit 2